MKNFIPGNSSGIYNFLPYIEKYEINDGKIIIYLSGGRNRIMPYTKENEKFVLEHMKMQVTTAKESNLESEYRSRFKCNILGLYTDFWLAIIQLSILSKSKYPVINCIAAGLFGLLSTYYGVIIAKDKPKYDELRKLILFVDNEDKINNDIIEHYQEMYGKDIKNANTITINDVDNYSLEEIQTMVELINEKEKQLTLKNKA